MATQARNQRVPDQPPLSRRIGVRFTDEDVAEFARVAAQEERSLGAVIRRSARAGLQQTSAEKSAA